MMHMPVLQGIAHLEIVVFQWSTEHGPCHDCGLPSAFWSPTIYGPKTAQYPTFDNRFCSVCAAGHAADGETIKRLTCPDCGSSLDRETSVDDCPENYSEHNRLPER